MANDIAGNPLHILDAAAANIITGLIRITKISWEPVAVDDTAEIKDGQGRTLYHKTLHDLGTATNAIMPEIADSDFVPPLVAYGLSVPTLTSGNHLMIYYDGPSPLKTT